MVAPKQSVPEAYITLGIDEGSSLDIVKSAYKKLALSTHPDKNPDNADATAQFQKISEAYNLLVKHLDRSTRPPREYSSRGPPRGPFGFGNYDEDDDDDDEYYDSDDLDEEDEMDYYMWMFQEFIKGRASRYAQSRFHHDRRPERVPESEEEYQARLRRSREAQVAAEERRVKEEAERKSKLEKERIREREEAEQRQKAKKANKKGQAEASRKKAEDTVRMQQQRAQTLRSATFAAARAGDAEKVKKGIWEDNVDAAGGEVKIGCETFVTAALADPKETLMHIAVKKGDSDLVKWLDAHSAEPDERNSQGLTAFHLAVQLGHIDVMKEPFFENYPPKESEHSAIYSAPKSTSVLLLAIDSCEPEVVWLILQSDLASSQDTNNAWSRVSTGSWKESMKKKSLPGGQKPDDVKLDEIRHLIMTFGGFTPPPTPKVGVQDKQWQSASVPSEPRPTHSQKPSVSLKQGPSKPVPQINGAPQPTGSANGSGGNRGRGRGRGRGRK